MTVQRDDTEPEEYRGSRGQRTPPDYRSDPNFTWPQKVPWSELGPDFAAAWGRANPKNPQPEGLEIVGQTGSGKTHLFIAMMQERQRERDGAAVFVATKQDDDIFRKLGWPITDNLDKAHHEKWKQFIYWPRTSQIGRARNEYLDRKVNELMADLWQPQDDLVVAFDEVGKVESLSAEAKANMQMYWREARSMGITPVGIKQRPQGALRDMHSETYWTAAFKPKDRADLERWAELFGARRDWMPVFDSLNRSRHEFILANPVHEEAYISWVDEPLRPVKARKRGPRWLLGGGDAGR